MKPLRRELLLALAGVAVSPRLLAQAEDYPNRPIRLIVPFAPGGGTDIVARFLGLKMGEAWKQAVVVDNRAGANGTIGAHLVAKSPPDGYTLTMMTASHSVNVTLQGTKHPYDLHQGLRAHQPGDAAAVRAGGESEPAGEVGEGAARARQVAARQARLTAPPASAARATSPARCSACSAMSQLTHIPYKGGEPAMTAVVAGQIDMLFSTLLQSRGLIQGGKLRPLAVTTPNRSARGPGAADDDGSGRAAL